MNQSRPSPYFQPAPPQTEIPAPLHLPAPTSAELLARLATVGGFTMGGTVGLIVLALTAPWNIGGLTLVLLVGDGLLWAFAYLASFPLRAAIADHHLRRDAQELEYNERQKYLALGRGLLHAWARRTYGRAVTTNYEPPIIVDGVPKARTSHANGRSRTDTAPDTQSWQEGALNAVQRARARVATDVQTADDETRPLGELGGPGVWTDDQAAIYDLWRRGIEPSARNCWEQLGINQARHKAAMQGFASIGLVTPPAGPGKGYSWSWRVEG